MSGHGRLAGKVALVTGAARGTGEAIARRFVDEGARVVIGDVQREAGRGVAEDLGAAAVFADLDVTSEDSWAAAVDATVRRFGALDVLVNNAAVLHLAALEDTSLADFERLFRVNLAGPFLGIRAVAPRLRAAGGGSIVNVASVDALQGKNGVAAYASTKWGLRGLTRVAAVELGQAGIRVNTVCPEAGSGDMIRPYVPDAIEDPSVVHGWGFRFLPYQKDRPHADRLGDVAAMVLFLASDESRSCTGHDYVVDGGNTELHRIKGAPGA